MTSPTTEQQPQHRGATQERNAVLVISSFERDHIFVGQVLEGATWRVAGVSSLSEALEVLPVWRWAVVVCDWEFPDGDWKSVLEALLLPPHPAPLVVTSRLADRHLWGEVLHFGGHDVLAKPLEERAVLWAVNSAWQRWDRRSEPITRAKRAAVSTRQ